MGSPDRHQPRDGGSGLQLFCVVAFGSGAARGALCRLFHTVAADEAEVNRECHALGLIVFRGFRPSGRGPIGSSEFVLAGNGEEHAKESSATLRSVRVRRSRKRSAKLFAVLEPESLAASGIVAVAGAAYWIVGARAVLY